tara:strand:+ start:112 stop:462 length:351 start_codon:yes stop_codon:yes gene_type:complete
MPYVEDSPIHGQGVFADKDYSQGDTIEMCPYLIADKDDFNESCILHDYMFYSPYEDDEDFFIPLGLAMVYNHSETPNAEWNIADQDERFIKFFAVKKIKKGEEILHDYGEPYWESR